MDQFFHSILARSAKIDRAALIFADTCAFAPANQLWLKAPAKLHDRSQPTALDTTNILAGVEAPQVTAADDCREETC